MTKPNAFLPDLGSEAMTAVMGDAWKSLSGLNLPATTLAELQRDYVASAAALWNETLQGLTPGAVGSALPDRRFAAKDWAENPASAYAARLYLLNAKTLAKMAEAVYARWRPAAPSPAMSPCSIH